MDDLFQPEEFDNSFFDNLNELKDFAGETAEPSNQLFQMLTQGRQVMTEPPLFEHLFGLNSTPVPDSTRANNFNFGGFDGNPAVSASQPVPNQNPNVQLNSKREQSNKPKSNPKTQLSELSTYFSEVSSTFSKISNLLKRMADDQDGDDENETVDVNAIKSAAALGSILGNANKPDRKRQKPRANSASSVSGMSEPAPSKKPPSAYLMFRQDVIPRIKQRHPSINAKLMAAKVRDLWNCLDDSLKQKYHEKQEAMQKEYDEEQRNYYMQSAKSISEKVANK